MSVTYVYRMGTKRKLDEGYELSGPGPVRVTLHAVRGHGAPGPAVSGEFA